jgi:hypothetical protein
LLAPVLVSEFANGGGENLGVDPQLNDISDLPLKEECWPNEFDACRKEI